MDTTTDVAVIGGGIGGSGLAAVLAAGGLSVTVLERTETFPELRALPLLGADRP